MLKKYKNRCVLQPEHLGLALTSNNSQLCHGDICFSQIILLGHKLVSFCFIWIKSWKLVHGLLFFLFS